MTAVQFAAAYCVATTSIQILSALIAMPRCAKRQHAAGRQRRRAAGQRGSSPLCGVDSLAEETLAWSWS